MSGKRHCCRLLRLVHGFGPLSLLLYLGYLHHPAPAVGVTSSEDKP
ncbi:MAG: hypothetical protein ACYS5W_12310 [Planctomycetota bacterium]|jgi:hypothetical protein